ncbi:hypothetical protein KJ866_00445 [Patescibacteria group bacterium]|nr:hypothetical protein [Patescibacteria group bacterium]MBU2220111.1 hypothetical protein [Patescibacteria group bacterium]MBU2264757.1 hypothetical protein [Patescibacteria group bacterium]
MKPGLFFNTVPEKEQGAIITIALVFGTIFILIFTGLTGFIGTQLNQSKQKVASYQALNIAEAGANYARWHIAHAPADFDFSGIYNYKDPEGAVIGQYDIQITPPGECAGITQIEATGWTADFPNIKRTILIKFGRPSLAQYSFLTNSDVWFGEDEELQGPFHSNGGIRMDGEQNSISTSANETYLCQPTHGCSPAQSKPGIWGTGNGNAEGLWQFPVPAIDFNAITLDLAQLKIAAQNNGYYFGPSGAFGYHVVFKNNGTFDLFKVTKLNSSVYGCNTDGVCSREQNDINKETLLQNYPLAAGECNAQNLIFLEDTKVWVNGNAKEKATVVAARFPDNPATNASIIIPDNLTRADPKDTLVALIAQKNILVPYYSPNVLEIQAVMVAQKGAVQRYYYSGSVKNKILVRGSIITNRVWTWSWVNSGGTVISGYKNTESYYEPDLIYNPPPFFPSSGEQQFISWQES